MPYAKCPCNPKRGGLQAPVVGVPCQSAEEIEVVSPPPSQGSQHETGKQWVRLMSFPPYSEHVTGTLARP